MVIGINKSFNVAGLHASNIVIPDSNLREIFKKGIWYEAPYSLCNCSTDCCYDECEDWLDQLNEYLDGNIEFAIAYLAEHMPQLKVRKPDATIFCG